MCITNNYKLETPNGISYRGGVFEFHLPHSSVCYFNPCGLKNSCSQRDSDDHSQMIQMWNHELLAYKVKTCPFLSYVKPPTLRLNHACVEVGHGNESLIPLFSRWSIFLLGEWYGKIFFQWNWGCPVFLFSMGTQVGQIMLKMEFIQQWCCDNSRLKNDSGKGIHFPMHKWQEPW